MVTYFTKNVLTQRFHKKYTHWIWFWKSIFILQIPIQSEHIAETYIGLSQYNTKVTTIIANHLQTNLSFYCPYNFTTTCLFPHISWNKFWALFCPQDQWVDYMRVWKFAINSCHHSELSKLWTTGGRSRSARRRTVCGLWSLKGHDIRTGGQTTKARKVDNKMH